MGLGVQGLGFGVVGFGKLLGDARVDKTMEMFDSELRTMVRGVLVQATTKEPWRTLAAIKEGLSTVADKSKDVSQRLALNPKP